MYASGRTTGVVVDLVFGVIQIVPVLEDYLLAHVDMRMDPNVILTSNQIYEMLKSKDVSKALLAGNYHEYCYCEQKWNNNLFE